MRLHQHILVSGAVSAGLYAISRSSVVALASFAAGFLIDVDHLIDYWRAHPRSLNIRHFFTTCEEYRLKSLLLVLHSWELLVMLAVLAYWTRSPLLLGIAIGFCQHLLFDQFGNYVHPGSYFFLYRWKQGFRGDRVFDIPPQYRDKHGNHQSS